MNFTRSTSDAVSSFQATLVNVGYGQLTLRDSRGRVSQKWTLAQPKCVIGSSPSCNLRCMLPGIADQHLLLVVGARQLFLRALSAKCERDGLGFHELVFSDDQTSVDFDLAGHRFEYARNHQTPPGSKSFVAESGDRNLVPEMNPATLPKAPITERMKFTFVRALENVKAIEQSRSNQRQSSDQGSAAQLPTVESVHSDRPAWVEEIVRDALRPVEARLEGLIGPVHNLERHLRRQIARRRKQRNKPASEIVAPVPQPMDDLRSQELIQTQETIHRIVADQTVRIEVVNERVADIVAQLATLERIVASETDQHHQVVDRSTKSGDEILRLQREMIELINALQSRIDEQAARQAAEKAAEQIAEPTAEPAVSEGELQWRATVQSRLDELHQSLRLLDDIQSQLELAVHYSQLMNDEWEARWQSIEEAARRPVVLQLPPVQLPPVQLPSAPLPPLSPESSIIADPPTGQTSSPPMVPPLASLPSFADMMTSFETPHHREPAQTSEPNEELAFAEAYEPPAAHWTESNQVADATDAPEVENNWDTYSAVVDSFCPPAIETEQESTFPTEDEAIVGEAAALPSWWNEESVASPKDESPTSDGWSSSGDSDEFRNEFSSLSSPMDHLDTVGEEPSDFAPISNDDAGWQRSEFQSESQFDDHDENAFQSPVASEAEDNFDSQTYGESAFSSENLSIVERSPFELAEPSEEPIQAAIPKPFSPIDYLLQDDFDDEQASDAPELELIDSSDDSSISDREESYRSEPYKIVDLFENDQEPIDELAASEVSHRSLDPAYDGSLGIELAEAENYNAAPIEETFLPADLASVKPPEDADESVEDYMRRLLARMRGVSETEVKLPGLDTPPLTKSERSPQTTSNKSTATAEESESVKAVADAWTEPFDPNNYVPRGAAPEKNRDIDALRELANSSARTAIQVSARRRHGSAILIKSSVALVGMAAGAALVSINGLRVNVALIATVASFLVAAIWGYDALATLRPLLQASFQTKSKFDAIARVKPETETE